MSANPNEYGPYPIDMLDADETEEESNMTKHTIKGYITYERSRYTDGAVIGFMVHKPSPEIWPDLAIVAEHSIEVEVPADFDPRTQLVENLRAQKRKAGAEYAAMVKELDDRINSLLALEMSA